MGVTYNHIVPIAAVDVDTTVGGIDLLSVAQQSTAGMVAVLITPLTADIYIAAAGTPLAPSTNAAAGTPLRAGVTYELLHTSGPIKAITASGSTYVALQIGKK